MLRLGKQIVAHITATFSSPTSVIDQAQSGLYLRLLGAVPASDDSSCFSSSSSSFSSETFLAGMTAVELPSVCIVVDWDNATAAAVVASLVLVLATW